MIPRSWCLTRLKQCSQPLLHPSRRFRRVVRQPNSLLSKQSSWCATLIPILTRTTNGPITCKKWMNLTKPSVKFWACSRRTVTASRLKALLTSPTRPASLHPKKWRSLPRRRCSWLATRRCTTNEPNFWRHQRPQKSPLFEATITKLYELTPRTRVFEGVPFALRLSHDSATQVRSATIEPSFVQAGRLTESRHHSYKCGDALISAMN